MGPRPPQTRAARLVDEAREGRRILGRATETPHPGVDLEVHRHLANRLTQRLRQLAARDRDAAAGFGGGPCLPRQQPAHDQDLLRVDQAAQLDRLFERRHRKAARTSLQCGVRDRHRAMAVAEGLHHGEEPRPFGQVAEDAGTVGADRAQVDIRPTKRARQRPPWRSTFMTSGISSSRSPASSPESPRRCAMRAPAAACT